MPHGFINDMLDVKLLILYITNGLLYPADTQTLYELCLQDDKLSYFDVMQAVPQMVESGHLEEKDGAYVITEKGREAAAITKDSLAFPVIQRANRAMETFNREIRRELFARTELVERPNGECLAVMHLDDEMGPLITIEYTCPSQRQAAFLTKAFPSRADKLYQLITETLTAKDEVAENAT